MANTFLTGGHNKKWILALPHPGGFFQPDRIFTIGIHFEGRLVDGTRGVDCVFIDCDLIRRVLTKWTTLFCVAFPPTPNKYVIPFPKNPLNLASSKQNHH